jgi:hypothetical protein
VIVGLAPANPDGRSRFQRSQVHRSKPRGNQGGVRALTRWMLHGLLGTKSGLGPKGLFTRNTKFVCPNKICVVRPKVCQTTKIETLQF